MVVVVFRKVLTRCQVRKLKLGIECRRNRSLVVIDREHSIAGRKGLFDHLEHEKTALDSALCL